MINKNYFLVLFIFLFPVIANCQSPEANFLCISQGVTNYINSRIWVENYVAREGIDLSIEYTSIAFQRDNSSGKLYISANIISMPCLLLSKHEEVLIFLAGVVTLPNIGHRIFRIGNTIWVNIRQKTDFYLFYETAKIQTETVLGLNYENNGIGFLIGVHMPWTSGYADDLKRFNLYVTAGLKIGVNDFVSSIIK